MLNWLKSLSPVTITEALRAVLPVLVLFEVLDWTPDQISGAILAVSAVMAVFLRGTTISTAKLDQRVDERVAADNAGIRGVGGKDGTRGSGTGSGYDKLSTYLLVASLASVLAVSACASAQKQKVTMAYQGTQSALAQFQDAEIQLYNLKTVTALNEDTHKKIHAVLARAFDAQEKVGSALQIWKTGQPAPVGVKLWLNEAERVLAEIRALLPNNEQVKLVQMLVPWIRAMLDTIKLLDVPAPPALVAVAEQGGL